MTPDPSPAGAPAPSPTPDAPGDGARLDAHLVAIGAFESRTRAQAAIRAGKIRVGGAVAARPSQRVPAGADVAVEGDAHPFVSRGGVKLEAALDAFGIDVAGRIALDLGASTGGFTDVLLRAGAARVYAVDVGTEQLHPSIAADARVVSLERTHARDLSPALIPELIDLIVCDVSFISLRLALPPALALAAPRARLVALVKPQFEVGPGEIGKGGRVRPGRANAEGVVEALAAWLPSAAPGWRTVGTMESPIAGGAGAREFLICGRRDDV